MVQILSLGYSPMEAFLLQLRLRWRGEKSDEFPTDRKMSVSGSQGKKLISPVSISLLNGSEGEREHGTDLEWNAAGTCWRR
jgi:hypothetical protein